MNWVSIREKYYGGWEDNRQNGLGVHIWIEPKGEGKYLRNRYDGEWDLGQRHGYGTFYYANGARYEGTWNRNSKEGYALFMDETGKERFAVFKDDKILKEFDTIKKRKLIIESSEANVEANLEVMDEIVKSGDENKKDAITPSVRSRAHSPNPKKTKNLIASGKKTDHVNEITETKWETKKTKIILI